VGGKTYIGELEHHGALHPLLVLELEQALLRWAARQGTGSGAGRCIVVVAIICLSKFFLYL
jgi:hypothetical protein